MARILDCVSLDVRIINLSSALVGMLTSSSKLFPFSDKAHLNSGVRLLLELYCDIVIKYVAFFTICVKLTMAFTFTTLPLSFYTSVSQCGCGFGLEQKYWQVNGFGEKRQRSVNLHTPIHPSLFGNEVVFGYSLN